ncbi:hypothetical protein RF11_09228 [Thelohanellus kitauei]|uniref:Uncharacterized protein n=1 Tax=Thelohanellus kitauei TaxID=669202 RepID=A0A0C2J093_THEKT|nr:hypothetical protein RF11_09228 [Thelohanellus kitauei]
MKRKLTALTEERLTNEGQNTTTLPILRCKGCRTYLSRRTGGVLSYMNRNIRANCKLSPEKILTGDARCFQTNLINWLIDCCEVCRWRNLVHFSNHLLGNGNGQRINGQTSDVVIQIDETLLKGIRRVNVGRLLGADENIPREEIEEWEEINKDGQLVLGRNHKRRITECHRQVDDNYKSGEVRLFIMEKRDQESLLSIIRRDVARGSIIWRDMWLLDMRIGRDGDGPVHEYVNYNERFGLIMEFTRKIETVGETEQTLVDWNHTIKKIGGEAGEILAPSQFSVIYKKPLELSFHYPLDFDYFLGFINVSVISNFGVHAYKKNDQSLFRITREVRIFTVNELVDISTHIDSSPIATIAIIFIRYPQAPGFWTKPWLGCNCANGRNDDRHQERQQSYPLYTISVAKFSQTL